MKWSTLVLLAIVVTPCAAQQAPEAPSSAFDGRWSVFLKCEDVQHRTGPVRGYVYTIAVEIVGGRLEGRFDESTPPAFVHVAGRVQADGTVLIEVDGLSGSPDATVGKVPRGTPYRYTMRGKLDADRGKAERVELRPCTAELRRQSSK